MLKVTWSTDNSFESVLFDLDFALSSHGAFLISKTSGLYHLTLLHQHFFLSAQHIKEDLHSLLCDIYKPRAYQLHSQENHKTKNTQHLKYKTGSIQTKIQFCCGVCLCVCKRERKNNWKNCEILCMSISHATYLIMRVRECNTNPWEPEADSQRLRRATLYTDPRSAEDLRSHT